MRDFHFEMYNRMMDMKRFQTKLLFIPSSRKSGQTYFTNFINLNENMKPLLNKWQFWCKPFGRDFYRTGGGYGWHIFELGFISIHTMPIQGEMCTKRHRKGFIVRFAYWFPIDRA